MRAKTRQEIRSHIIDRLFPDKTNVIDVLAVYAEQEYRDGRTRTLRDIDWAAAAEQDGYIDRDCDE